MNIPAKDVALRPEFTAVLAHANIEPSELITLDDLPALDSLPETLKPESTRWILVDHNALQGKLGSCYESQVIGTIDHHDEENKVPKDTGDEPRIVHKTGSCTSLVTNYCREAWDNLSAQSISMGAALAQDDARGLVNDQANSSTWDAEIAKVVLSSILIDTHNLQSKDKVTKHDIDAATYLEAKIASSPRLGNAFSREEYFEQIFKAKQHIDHLKLHDMLRKDYKEWSCESQTMGVSSVVKNIDFLAGKAEDEKYGSGASEAFAKAADGFATDRGLGLYAIMTTSTSAEGNFQRELYLSATNTEAVRAASKFEKASSAELGLAQWHGSISDVNCTEDKCWRRIWQQRELQHSRKRVAPLLRQSLGE